MMIPMISIDGISMPVNRDGINLMSNMPLETVASQVLERGAAFEAAVEKFQPVDIAQVKFLRLLYVGKQRAHGAADKGAHNGDEGRQGNQNAHQQRIGHPEKRHCHHK